MAAAPEYAAAPLVNRRMLEADLAEVAMVEAESYMFPWNEGIFRECLRAGYCCRVLEREGDIVAYAIMAAGAAEAHVLNVCVREDQRGQSVGRSLMEWLLEEARGTGNSWIFLEVRPSNRPALKLYRSLGFVEVGVRRGYYQAVGGREDALVHRLDLDAWTMAKARAMRR
jgi:ribosomal-protein-alanine N-acetyltransferase